LQLSKPIEIELKTAGSSRIRQIDENFQRSAKKKSFLKLEGGFGKM
jgi:hypothetical protein